jgi:hypothetical protein
MVKGKLGKIYDLYKLVIFGLTVNLAASKMARYAVGTEGIPHRQAHQG